MEIVIGVVPRYKKVNGTNIVYITEDVRRTFQKEGCSVELIMPILDVDHIDTKSSDFPPFTSLDKIKVEKLLSRCDALLLPGGKRTTPYDLFLLEMAIKKDMPVLGICLGMQTMSFYKEKHEEELEKVDSTINHNYLDDDTVLAHNVIIDKASKLYSILKQEKIMVNSYHNYKAFESKLYKVVARSEDNIIEAMEYPKATFNIGVQWHPEISYSFDKNSQILIKSFIKAAKNYHEKKIESKQLEYN